MKNLVDSNVLIAFFRKEETLHEKAITVIENLDQFTISEQVLFEVGTILLLKEDKLISHKAIETLTQNDSIKILKLKDSEFFETLNAFPYLDTKLSMVDVSLLILSKSRNLELMTFDEELNKQKNFFLKK